MTIYCLGGVSGSGKTHLRRHHPILSRLPCIDIAEAYAQHGDIHWQDALEILIQELVQHLADEGEDEDVVLEAFFKPGGQQREEVEGVGARFGAPVRFIWCHAPRETCMARVLMDAGVDGGPRSLKRQQFIQSIGGEFFELIQGEELLQQDEDSTDTTADEESDLESDEESEEEEDDEEEEESDDDEELLHCPFCDEAGEAANCPGHCGRKLEICYDCAAFPGYSGGCPKDYLIEQTEHDREFMCDSCRLKDDAGCADVGWECERFNLYD